MKYLPRCYNDIFMACDEHGTPLNLDESPEGYVRYLNWLAEYLFKRNIVFSD